MGGIFGVADNLEFLPVLAAFFLVALGSGFILHEMAHKFSAIHFGHLAEFRMWTKGLAFMFLLALFSPLIFIAPGAVYIGGGAKRITKRENGLISLAGPATNVVIAIIGLTMLAIVGPIPIGYGGIELWSALALINVFLALFNLLPVYPLDGSKVLAWSKPVYFGFAILVVVLYLMLSGIIGMLLI